MDDRVNQIRSTIWSDELLAGIGTQATTVNFMNGTDVVIDAGSVMIALDRTNTVIKIVNSGNGKVWIIDLVDVRGISYQNAL